ncbi:MAG: zinc finger domain-containing protein [Nitrososphaeraceae archaeon]
MHSERLGIKNRSTYVCPRCTSEVLSILNHPVEQNMVIETANCPQCNLVWQDQWILPVFPVSKR